MSEAVKFFPDEEEEQLEQDVPVFDDMDAEYLLDKLAEAEKRFAQEKAWYSMQLSKAQERYEKTKVWVESNLRPYFDTVPATGKKIKSYELRGGVLKLAKQEPKYDVDNEKMVPWLEENQQADFVKVKKEACWGDFKKTLPKDKEGNLMTVASEDGRLQLVTADGEVVPGITVTQREDKFTVTIK